jgi:hypothetical protein
MLGSAMVRVSRFQEGGQCGNTIAGSGPPGSPGAVLFFERGATHAFGNSLSICFGSITCRYSNWLSESVERKSGCEVSPDH